MLTRLKADRIDTGREILRNHEGKIRLPTKVVDVILMEMNGTVMLGRLPPTHLGPVPMHPSHAARGKVNDLTLQTLGADILGPCGRDPLGKIPACKDRRFVRLGGTVKGRRFDLSVEMAGRKSVDLASTNADGGDLPKVVVGLG